MKIRRVPCCVDLDHIFFFGGNDLSLLKRYGLDSVTWIDCNMRFLL